MKKLIARVRTKIGVLLVDIIRKQHGVVVFFGDSERRKALSLIHEVHIDRKMLLADQEAYQIMMFAKRTLKIKGEIAEVGVYTGGSAKLIAEMVPDKEIHLFDSFEGLPTPEDVDPEKFTEGQYGADLEDVRAYLSAYPNVHLYKGFFPATSGPIESKKFSFVHLDVDLYQSTKESLEFFYPRMSPGGVLLSHDYMTAEGVRKAFDEFMQDKPEALFESSWSQCFFVKI